MKKLLSKLLDLDIYKNTFLIVCFLYTFPFTSHFTSIIIKFIIIWGLIVLFKNLIDNKLFIKNKKTLTIILILILIFIGILVNYKNNLILNINVGVYLIIQMLVMYVNKSKENVDSIISNIYFNSYIIVTITFLFGIINIILSVFNFNFIVNNGALDLRITGFFEGRLWGIYGNPNTLANISCISLFLSLIISPKTKKNKILNRINILLQLTCVILSNSRSSIISIIISLFLIVTIIFIRNIDKTKLKERLKVILKFGTILFSILLVLLGIYLSLININGKSIFGRVNLTSDVSNGRDAIWKSGLKVSSDNILFGVGPKNVKNNVYKYLKEYTFVASSGIAADMHNIYLQVLVSHGIFVCIIFILFLIWNLKKTLKYLLLEKYDEKYRIVMMLFELSITILLFNIFDSNLLYFFSMFITAIFWYSLSKMNQLVELHYSYSSKRKILFFIDNLDGGGAEKVLVNIVNNINTNKFKIVVKTLFNEGVYIEKLNKNIKYIACIKKPNIWKKRIIYRVIKYLPAKIIYILFISEESDVEIAFLETAVTKVISGSNDGAKKIAWIHTNIYDKPEIKKWFANKINFVKAYKNFDKIVCVSDGAKEGFIDETNINENVLKIYNPIDKEDIISKSKEICDLNIKNNSFLIVTVGRLVMEKGYLRLLKVINRIVKQNYNISLWIIGEGQEREKLEKYINENNLESFVTLVGFVENPYKYIAKADLFASSSINEGFSLVLAEAIVLDIPVISTKTAGPIEILDNNKYGLLVENSEEGLYNGIKDIISNKKLYENLKEKVRERKTFFGLDNIIGEVEELISEE